MVRPIWGKSDEICRKSGERQRHEERAERRREISASIAQVKAATEGRMAGCMQVGLCPELPYNDGSFEITTLFACGETKSMTKYRKIAKGSSEKENMCEWKRDVMNKGAYHLS